MKCKSLLTKLKQQLSPWLRALTNPHFLISVGIAWFITNGWAYCAAGFGWYFEIDWLMEIGAVWMGILWMPGTPEKLLTIPIAIGILRILFPDDTRTLLMMRQKFRSLLAHTKTEYARVRAWLCGKFRRIH